MTAATAINYAPLLDIINYYINNDDREGLASDLSIVMNLDEDDMAALTVYHEELLDVDADDN